MVLIYLFSKTQISHILANHIFTPCKNESKKNKPPRIALFPKRLTLKLLLFPKKIYLQSNLISPKKINPTLILFP
jgi:hypothetical protein